MKILKFASKIKPKLLFIISLVFIIILFITTSWISSSQLVKNILKNEISNQQQVSEIIAQSLERYFNTLKVIIKIAASDPIFKMDITSNEQKIFDTKVLPDEAKNILEKQEIFTVLSSPVHAIIFPSPYASKIVNDGLKKWQIYKGLPLYDTDGSVLVAEKRLLASNIRRNYNDIRYLFYAKANGNIVFIEPFDIQKNIKVYNYSFRDALRLVNEKKETSISEAYITNEFHGMQSITVATPIFDNDNVVKYIFGASISAKTLKDSVFLPLKEKMDLHNGTSIYLVDRHAHVIASSNGENIYFPASGEDNDDHDLGNLRSRGIFRKLDWHPGYFEKGTSWNRKTWSWNLDTIKSIYHLRYINKSGVEVLATFMPISLDNRSVSWGLLIETPLNHLLAPAVYLKMMLFFLCVLLGAVVTAILIISLRYFSRLEIEIKKKEAEINKMAAQVAHDIKSPIVALNMLLKNLLTTDEKIRVMVHKSVNRINDIAHNLLFYSKNNISNSNNSGNHATSESLYLALECIIAEKRFEHPRYDNNIHLKVSENACHIFSNVNLVNFKRAISNLLNNSIEAIDVNGSVNIDLYCDDDSRAYIVIEDNGCGMPKKILHKITEHGFSFNKKNGNGYGLHFAKTCIQDVNGEFKIDSIEGKGTKILIALPLTQAPDWFCGNITVNDNESVVVVDDDLSIHDVWNERFKNTSINISHFFNSGDFCNYLVNNPNKNLFLIDYELLTGCKNGLDIIEELSISDKSILVTSYYDSPVIRNRCHELKVRIIPKAFVTHIKISTYNNDVPIILIDDDELMRNVWILAAKKAGKTIATYNSPAEFDKYRDSVSKKSIFYIDSEIGDSIRGEVYAKELYELGFKELHLATGHRKEKFAGMWWLKSIVSKEPIFF